MAKKHIPIAIAYDFDGTLAPGNMQEHSFIPELGIDVSDFWSEVKKIARENDMNEILAYMQLMLEKGHEKKVKISKEAFRKHGKEINFFDGVEQYFDMINTYAKQHSVHIDHYIISSGLRDILHGTSIARHFKLIFASGYKFDIHDVAEWPALAVDYTSKTQYLFRINKGIDNVHDNSRINKFMAEDERPMPFKNIIYIGDGETDIPAMKMTKFQGGTSIAVYNPNKRKIKGQDSLKELCEKLIIEERADYMAPADYSDDSPLVKIIKLTIDRIVAYEELKHYKK
jgi:hypothetical protein